MSEHTAPTDDLANNVVEVAGAQAQASLDQARDAYAAAVREAADWSAYAPRLIDRGDGSPVVDTAFTRLTGKSPILLAGMTPTTVDPAQKKMFMIMPVVFGWIFKEMPSGLVLYWLVQNILTIIQQTITQKS